METKQANSAVAPISTRHGISGLGLFTVIVWGASFVFTRMALQSLTPYGIVACRMWMGAIFLYAVQRARGRKLWPERADAGVCLLLGIVLATHLLLQNYGLQFTSATNTGWIIGFIPVCIAVGATLTGRQRLTGLGWTGVLLGAAGVLLVTLQSPPDFTHAGWGNLCQITSCVTWTVYTLLAAAPVARNGALRVTAAGMLVAALLISLAAGAWGVTHAELTWRALAALAFLGLIASGIAYYCWFAAQHTYGPARLGSLLYLEPFATLITAALIMPERITWNAIAGGCAVLVGVWVVARATPAPSVATEEPG